MSGQSTPDFQQQAERQVDLEENRRILLENHQFQGDSHETLQQATEHLMEAETGRLQESNQEAIEHERGALRRQNELLVNQERARIQSESQLYLNHDQDQTQAAVESFAQGEQTRLLEERRLNDEADARRALNEERLISMQEKERQAAEERRLADDAQARIAAQDSDYQRRLEWRRTLEERREELESRRRTLAHPFDSLIQDQETRVVRSLAGSLLPGEAIGSPAAPLLQAGSTAASPGPMSMSMGSDEAPPPPPPAQQQQQQRNGMAVATPGTEKRSKRHVVLLMTVDIGDGRKEVIKVHSGDEPHDLAVAFCRQHQLADLVIDPLTAHIEQNLPKSHLTPEERADYFRQLSQGGMSPLQQGPLPPARPLRTADPTLGGSRHLVPQIDPNSRLLAAKSRSKEPVYERLHQQATERQLKLEEQQRAAAAEEARRRAMRVPMSQTSKVLAKGRVKTDHDQNYGERLYREGAERMKQRDEAAQKAAQERDLKDPELTFHPKISKLAAKLKRGSEQPTWARLEATAELRKAEREKQEEERRKRELDGCTFQPKVSERSMKLAESHEAGAAATQASGAGHSPQMAAAGAAARKAAHQRLFQDAERRRIRQEEYQNWFPEEHTFHPEIRTMKHPQGNVPAPDRLYQAAIKHREYLEALQAQSLMGIDPETGQPLFQPRTGRPPNVMRQDPNLPVGERLFAARYEFQDAREHLREKERQMTHELSNLSFTHEVSLRLLEEKKHRRYRELFILLDTNQDGVVEPHEVNASTHPEMDPGLAAELIPIMQQCPTPALTFPLFVDQLEAALRDEKWPHPHLLALPATSLPTAPEEEPTFHPQISDSSRRLAAQKRGKETLEERLLQEAKQWQRNREEAERRQEQAKLAECTFTPRTLSPQQGGAKTGGEGMTTIPVEVAPVEAAATGGAPGTASRRRVNPEDVVRRLTTPKKTPARRADALSSEEIQEAMCTFHPHTNASICNCINFNSCDIPHI
ncbi:hypothetical protein PAPYR_8418 [Paratrimastix pyriformis]|uniref:EF-hand domain-containing protein n=1 Tax=Paratrimastix pyriformis TaxID=342808 RepID=A0ABQ8UE53_9EUKA|nr:hypothetical protein PAPYR_8418 [Paratrimastix pyriformis]